MFHTEFFYIYILGDLDLIMKFLLILLFTHMIYKKNISKKTLLST